MIYKLKVERYKYPIRLNTNLVPMMYIHRV